MAIGTLWETYQQKFPNQPDTVNGVSLKTKAGTVKRRFSPREKQRILRCKKSDLEHFKEVFAPRSRDYAITRSKSEDPRDWVSGHGALGLDLIARHLLGARLPMRLPVWVAPRAFRATRFIAIDVDFRGDKESFRRRCQDVERCLHRLRVPTDAQLVYPTPSGGRHYYFFTTTLISVREIPRTLELAGLKLGKGLIEAFPSQSHGLRLPFGHIPGLDHDSRAWVKFIRNYQSKKFRRINWLACKTRASRSAERRLKAERIRFNRKPSSAKKSFELKKRSRQQWSKPPKSALRRGADSQESYRELLTTPVRSPEQVDELYRRGIRQKGSRVIAIKRLAWTLVFKERMPLECVVNVVSEWTYQTGKFTSRDVQQDEAEGTRKVHDQIAKIVSWYGKRREHNPARAAARILPREISAFAKATAGLSLTEQISTVQFLLRFLDFAKSNGRKVPNGWECRPCIRGIVRKWPGCSGMRYKPLMDLCQSLGLIRMTREKRQSNNGTGRARTYFIPGFGVDRMSSVTLKEAFELAGQQRSQLGTFRNFVGSHLEASDTYSVCPSALKQSNHRNKSAPLPRNQPIPGFIGKSFSNELKAMGSFRQPGGLKQRTTCANKNRGITGHDPIGYSANQQAGEEYSHEGRSDCPVAIGSPKCLNLANGVQGLHDSVFGRVEALCSPAGRCLAGLDIANAFKLNDWINFDGLVVGRPP